MYLIGQCEWENHKNLLESLCNALLELISSFYNAGQFNFMGLSITRNSIICLNHLSHQMQVCFNKNVCENTDILSVTCQELGLSLRVSYIAILHNTYCIAVVDSILVRGRSHVKLVAHVTAKQRSSGSRFGSAIFGGSDERDTHCTATCQSDSHGTEWTVSHVASVHHGTRRGLFSERTRVYRILQPVEKLQFLDRSLCKSNVVCSILVVCTNATEREWDLYAYFCALSLYSRYILARTQATQASFKMKRKKKESPIFFSGAFLAIASYFDVHRTAQYLRWNQCFVLQCLHGDHVRCRTIGASHAGGGGGRGGQWR